MPRAEIVDKVELDLMRLRLMTTDLRAASGINLPVGPDSTINDPLMMH
jgi:hypothetical protein